MDFISRILQESRKRLIEADEASKNLAVEALKQVSETLDLLKSNVDMALTKIEVVPDMDSAKTKLHGLASIIDANITEVAEIIADVTGSYTPEGNTSIEENIAPIEEDVEITSDDAVKNVDSVKKLASSDVNVVIDDDAKKSSTM